MTSHKWQKMTTTAAMLGFAFVVGWVSEGKYYHIQRLWRNSAKLEQIERHQADKCPQNPWWWPWI